MLAVQLFLFEMWERISRALFICRCWCKQCVLFISKSWEEVGVTAADREKEGSALIKPLPQKKKTFIMTWMKTRNSNVVGWWRMWRRRFILCWSSDLSCVNILHSRWAPPCGREWACLLCSASDAPPKRNHPLYLFFFSHNQLKRIHPCSSRATLSPGRQPRQKKHLTSVYPSVHLSKL